MATAKTGADSERKAFKDYFDKVAAKDLAQQFKAADSKFDDKKFVKLASAKLDDLEFNDRVKQFSNALAETLPAKRSAALTILTKSLPEALPDCEAVTDGWLQWPLGQFIADHCVDDFKPAMKAMEALTQRFSSEFAVRPFVDRYQDDTFSHLEKLTGHKSPHVRRWCSEGTRTRLPWGAKLTKLIEDPSPIWSILEALKDDDELYVRKSVANNLNDIAKDHPELVLQRCKQWAKNSNSDRDWVIKHGLRTLIKDGDPVALKIIGYGPPKNIKATLKATPKQVKIGAAVTLEAQLSSSSSRKQGLLIDFVVHYVRKGGKTSAKTFKWKTLELAGKGEETLNKKLAVKKTSIRALYPGTHKIELQVNGEIVADTKFVLKT